MSDRRADLATVAAGFGERLRAVGVPATPERCARFAAAVVLAEAATAHELYWLARVTLVDDVGQLPAFDAEFHRMFGGMFGGLADVATRRGDSTAPPLPRDAWPGPRVRPGRGAAPGTDVPMPAGGAGARRTEGAGRLLMTASAQERLRHKDFASWTEEELAELRHLAVRLTAPPRRARRTRHAPGGRHLDLRRTLRAAHRTGGDPVRQVRRRRRSRPRRVVLLADVSGSMEAYSRAYLQLLHGAVRGTRAEAFVMATRLTRLTRALRAGTADQALERAAARAPDWSGGTRLGAGLKTFLDEHGRRGLARGAVVVVVSDGWERADPALLGEQMARLRRLAHRVVWVNPRSAAEAYQPLVGGMAAALPHVDRLVPGHTPAALDEVAEAIAEG